MGPGKPTDPVEPVSPNTPDWPPLPLKPCLPGRPASPWWRQTTNKQRCIRSLNIYFFIFQSSDFFVIILRTAFIWLAISVVYLARIVVNSSVNSLDLPFGQNLLSFHAVLSNPEGFRQRQQEKISQNVASLLNLGSTIWLKILFGIIVTSAVACWDFIKMLYNKYLIPHNSAVRNQSFKKH